MFCRQCGKELEEDAQFCSECGEEVEKGQAKNKDGFDNLAENRIEKDEEAYKYEESKSRRKKIKLFMLIGSVIVVIMIIIAMTLIYCFSKRTETDNRKVADIQEVSKEKEQEIGINEEEYIFPYSVVLQIKGASDLQIIFYEKESRINFPSHYWNTVMHII